VINSIKFPIAIEFIYFNLDAKTCTASAQYNAVYHCWSKRWTTISTTYYCCPSC